MFYGRILTHSRVLKKACYASTYPMCDYQPPSPIRKGRMATTRSSQTLPVYNRKVLKVNRGFEKSYQLLIVILPHTHPSVGQPLQPRSSCQVEPASFRPRKHGRGKWTDPKFPIFFLNGEVRGETRRCDDYCLRPHHHLPGAVARRPLTSRSGGAPKRRLYSRLNCDGLS